MTGYYLGSQKFPAIKGEYGKKRSLETIEISSIIIVFTSENFFLHDDLILSFNAGKCFLKLPTGT